MKLASGINEQNEVVVEDKTDLAFKELRPKYTKSIHEYIAETKDMLKQRRLKVSKSVLKLTTDRTIVQ